MSIFIDGLGIHIDELNDIINDVNIAYRGIYGEDINLDQDTADGQTIGLFSKLHMDIQEAIVQVYDSRDPDTAQGTALDSIMKIAGLIRNGTTKSTVQVDITTIADNITLPNDYTLSDELNQIWIIDEETIIASQGVQSVGFKAQDWGSVEALPNTITIPVTIIIGVDSVNNSIAATAGRDEETDSQARIRRNRSTEKPARSSLGSILASLFNDVDNVVDAVVYENQTDIYDAVRDINGNTIWAIVEGGLNNDIAEVLAKQKTVGADYKGSTTGTFTETITKPNGGFRTLFHTVNFDRPTITDIFITLDVAKKLPTDIIDKVAIKNAMIKRLYEINENAIVTDLYAYVYQGGTNFIATNLQLSKDNITYETDVLEAGLAEKFKITEANITITVI